jgi:hypothetical protein
MASASSVTTPSPRRELLPRYGSLVLLLGFLITSFAFYPGLTSPDSDNQFSQLRTSKFDDGHPLVSTLIWRLTDLVVPGPAGYFFLLLLLYWFGFFVLSQYFHARGRAVYLVSLGLPFAPFLINFSGTLWKDVLLFDCYLVATAVALYYQGNSRRINVLLLALLLASILVGALARHNSALAAVPLLILLWTARGHAIPSVFRLAKAYVLSGVIVASSVVVGLTVLDHAVTPTKAHLARVLFLFDLLGISHQLGKNIVPGTWNDDRILATCYEPKWWDSIWVRCGDFLKEVKAREWDNLPGAWIKAVRAHPKEYLKHRLEHFRAFFWVNDRHHVFNREVTPLTVEYGFKQNFMLRFFDESIERLRTFAGTKYLFSRGFWLVYSVALCFLCFTLFAAGHRLLLPELLISLSGASYAVPLIFVGVSVDLRYVYWTIACCCIATLMLLASLKRPELVRSTIGRHGSARP